MRRFWRPRPRRFYMSRNFPAFLVVALALVASLALGLLIVESRITPIVEYVGMAQAKQTATQIIYDTISAYLVKNGVTYDDLVAVDKGEDGKVTAIKTNIVMVNRMESEISLEISQKLSTLSKTQVAIPLGNILNGELFLGRGPHINIKISPVGTIDTHLTNEFVSAGINQTKQKIQMDIALKVGVILPGRYKETDVKAAVAIAETVIVGDIPDSYTHVTGDHDSLIGKINDYMAE